MPFEEFEHAGIRYAVQFTYALPDDAWCVELSEVVPAPAAWADLPNAKTSLPGTAFVTAMVPDEELTREPTIHVHDTREHGVPYAVMRWYMEKVALEIERCRGNGAATSRSDR